MTVSESIMNDNLLRAYLLSTLMSCKTFCGECEGTTLNNSCPAGRFRERLRKIAEKRNIPWGKIESMDINFSRR